LGRFFHHPLCCFRQNEALLKIGHSIIEHSFLLDHVGGRGCRPGWLFLVLCPRGIDSLESSRSEAAHTGQRSSTQVHRERFLEQGSAYRDRGREGKAEDERSYGIRRIETSD
jgi:hypothetical protein